MGIPAEGRAVVALAGLDVEDGREVGSEVDGPALVASAALS